MWFKYITLSLLIVVVSTEKVRYDNYALYKVIPNAEDHLAFLNDLASSEEGLDFWNAPTRIGDYVNVVTPPELRQNFEHTLKKRGIYSELMLDNIQEAFDAQVYSRKKRSASGQLFWTNYQTIDEIYDWFDHLAQNYSNIVSLITVGQSHEGRNITGIRISRGTSRRAFVLEAGQVGADWLSPTVLTYIIDQLVRGTNPETRAASEDFEWHIFPIVNPDGHQFSQDSVRLWVNNRRPTSANTIGVDLTRNWNSQWSVSGGSFDPTADNFIGLGPFSEPETRALSRYIEDIGGRLTGFLSFRAFGQRLVIPFAHSSQPMYNFDEMIMVGRRAMGSLAVRFNTQYLVGNSLEVLNGATGSSVDWAKHRFNPPIAATYYLRDDGTWGYTLPVNQVEPSCLETFDSLLAIIREARLINVI